MDFEDFEGFKRIKNDKNLTIEKIYSVIEKYQKELGNLEISLDLENMCMLVDLEGVYQAEIRLEANYIIIERLLEEGCIGDRNPNFMSGKNIKYARADRMIEQIYDLINDYMDDEKIVEHITSVKKILKMTQSERIILSGGFSLGSKFEIKDEDGNILYEALQKQISSIYTIKNLQTKREEVSLNYSEYKKDQFTILANPFRNFVLKKDNSTPKTRFIGNDIIVSADYTDNHYLVELDEVVIGAIDCLDPMLKQRYRIEINDLNNKNIVIAIAIMMDIYNYKNKMGVL